jgi:hypothetical protein
MSTNYSGIASAIYLKDSTIAHSLILFSDNYWLYHKTVLEDPDEEKLSPAEKVWLIVKYINNTSNYS